MEAPSDPPGMEPKINYTRHQESVAAMTSFFAGLTVDDMPDGEGWATKRVQPSTHNSTHMDAPYHFHATTHHGRTRALSVVDDFAVLEMDTSQAKLAFQVVSDRYEQRRSTCITTNRPFKDWTKVFPDPLNAQVIAERITEHAEVFLLDGKSYRNQRT